MGRVGLASALLATAAACSARELLTDDPAEVQRLSGEAAPGDEIVLRDGVYQRADILFTAEGTAERPVVLRAETPGGVVVRGESRLRIGGEHAVVSGLVFDRAFNGDHLVVFREDSKRLARRCRLTDCVLVDCNPRDPSDESRWVSLYGEHNRIDHCRIEGKTTKGTTVAVFLGDGPARHRIDHNLFGPRPDFGRNGGETIRVGDSGSSQVSAMVRVDHNLFVECNGEAEIISSKSCENRYDSNAFLRCSGALTLRHGDRCRVEGNWFLGEEADGSGGVRITGEGHRVVNNYFSALRGDDHRAALSIMRGQADDPQKGYAPVRGAVVAYNTFVDCEETLVVGLADDDVRARAVPEGCTIANNLIVSRHTPVDLRSRVEGFSWCGNLIESEAEPHEANGLTPIDDAGLRRDSEGLWRLKPGSPAVDAADPIVEAEHDIFGHRREPPADVGCEELRPNRHDDGPIGREAVGPTWSRKQPDAAS